MALNRGACLLATIATHGFTPSQTTGEPRVGFLGELQFDSLTWLRDRVFDGATHAFLSRDSDIGLLGYVGALTNPYLYANNNPLSWIDPLGRKPMSMEDYKAYRDQESQGHLLAVVAVAVIVTALVVTGGAAGPLIMVGAGLGAGTTALGEAVQGKGFGLGAIVQGA